MPETQCLIVDKPISPRSHPTGERAILNGSSIDFIFSIHTLPNMPRIFKAIRASNPNIVAIEMPGLEPPRKAEIEQRINQAIRDSQNAPMQSTESYQQLGGLSQIICSELDGVDTNVSLIDVDINHPAMAHYRLASRALDIFACNKTEDEYVEYINQTAQFNAMREAVMATQLEALAENNSGAKIAVLTGAVHTPMYHEVAQVVPSARRFIGKLVSADMHTRSDSMRYDETDTLVRRARLGLPLSKAAITQAMKAF